MKIVKKKTDAHVFMEIPVPNFILEDLYSTENRQTEEQLNEEDLYRESINKIRSSIITQIIKMIKFLDLTVEQREVVLLMYRKGKTLTEVSRKMGISTSRVQTARDTALRKIKRGLKRCGINNPNT